MSELTCRRVPAALDACRDGLRHSLQANEPLLCRWEYGQKYGVPEAGNAHSTNANEDRTTKQVDRCLDRYSSNSDPCEHCGRDTLGPDLMDHRRHHVDVR